MFWEPAFCRMPIALPSIQIKQYTKRHCCFDIESYSGGVFKSAVAIAYNNILDSPPQKKEKKKKKVKKGRR